MSTTARAGQGLKTGTANSVQHAHLGGRGPVTQAIMTACQVCLSRKLKSGAEAGYYSILTACQTPAPILSLFWSFIMLPLIYNSTQNITYPRKPCLVPKIRNYLFTFFKNLHLFYAEFIPKPFVFVSLVSSGVSFFCAISASGLGRTCSFPVRIISVWHGELTYGLSRPWVL